MRATDQKILPWKGSGSLQSIWDGISCSL